MPRLFNKMEIGIIKSDGSVQLLGEGAHLKVSYEENTERSQSLGSISLSGAFTLSNDDINRMINMLEPSYHLTIIRSKKSRFEKVLIRLVNSSNRRIKAKRKIQNSIKSISFSISCKSVTIK